jgi:hypothetical protein
MRFQNSKGTGVIKIDIEVNGDRQKQTALSEKLLDFPNFLRGFKSESGQKIIDSNRYFHDIIKRWRLNLTRNRTGLHHQDGI